MSANSPPGDGSPGDGNVPPPGNNTPASPATRRNAAAELRRIQSMFDAARAAAHLPASYDSFDGDYPTLNPGFVVGRPPEETYIERAAALAIEVTEEAVRYGTGGDTRSEWRDFSSTEHEGDEAEDDGAESGVENDEAESESESQLDHLDTAESQSDNRPGIPRMKDLPWADLKYIGAYDEHLDCSICQSPFIEPITIQCGHTFCRRCLDQHQAYGNEICPIDRLRINFLKDGSGIIVYDSPRIIRNMLDNLSVECPNVRCDYICPRSGLEHHYTQQCQYTLVACPDRTCEKMIARVDASGDGQCDHGLAHCPRCNRLVDRATMADHELQCRHHLIDCRYCSKPYKLFDIDEHHSVCNKRLRECRFANWGCDFKAKLSDFGQHDEKCPYKASCLAEINVNESQATARRLEAELAELKAKYEEAATRLRRIERASESANPFQTRLDYPTLSGERGLDHQEEVPIPPGTELDRADTMTTQCLERITRLERDVAAMIARHDHELRTIGNEMGLSRQQVIDARNTTSQLAMQVRWLLDTVRVAKRATSSLANAGAGNTGGGGGGDGGSASTAPRDFNPPPRRLSDHQAPRL